MAGYSMAVRSPAAAAGAAYVTLHTAATERARIREISIFTSAATLSSVGLIRPNNTPVATTSSLGQALDPADAASTVNIDTAWSTAPTIAATPLYHERSAIPAVSGAGLIWTWPPDAPLVVAVSSWIVIWNFGGSAGAACDIRFKWDE